MPRTTQAGTAYPANYRGEVVRLAQVTTNVKTWYFSNAETDFNGNHYLPRLVVDEAIHRYDSLQADGASLKLVNADAYLDPFLFSEAWEGALCVFLDYFTALGDGLTASVELLRGKLGERTEKNDRIVAWSLLPLYDPQNISAPSEIWNENCRFRFKDPRCGYVDGVDPDDSGTGLPFTSCNKHLANCQARGRTHRFPGFLQVTVELVKVYPPKPDPSPRPPAGGGGHGSGRFSSGGPGGGSKFHPR